MLSFKTPKEEKVFPLSTLTTESDVNRSNAKSFINNFEKNVKELNKVYNAIGPYCPHGILKEFPGDIILTTAPINILGEFVTLQMRFSIDSKTPKEIVILPETKKD
jgi:hypothetical protein